MGVKILREDEVEEAAALLKRGELVVFPTETVYGLGTPISCESGIEKIYEAKGRFLGKPLIAHISSLDQVELLSYEIPKEFYLLAEAFFPGPLSIVLKKQEGLSERATGGTDTIACRMPDHKVALALIEKVGEPLFGTSANISGKQSGTRPEKIVSEFPNAIAALIDCGPLEAQLPSTVLSLLDPKKPTLLREGPISKTALEEILNENII